jgi:molybdopterin converting factor small subunit
MAVAIKLPTVLRPLVGGAERVEADGATVGEVVAALDPVLRRRLTDEQGAVRRHVNIYLGNDNIRDLDGLETPLKDGDELMILPSIAGG